MTKDFPYYFQKLSYYKLSKFSITFLCVSGNNSKCRYQSILVIKSIKVLFIDFNMAIAIFS